MTATPRGPKLRLWVVSLALFAGGFAGRLVLDAQGDIASSYLHALSVQWYAYGAGLLVWAAWCVFQAPRSGRTHLGCAIGILLAFASFIAVLSTVPK